MAKPNLYTVGGTIQAGDALYIPRKADEELLDLCRDGTFAYILSARQVGKSSLMVRTAKQLDNEKIRSVIIDLSKIGVQVTAEDWYFGLLYEVKKKLIPDTDVVSWWHDNVHIGVTQKLALFFQEILLAKVADPVVIFVDEIDTTLSLNFTDDFFAAIRYLYNARAHITEFQRLSFVLIGVATPSDLITDPHRTPFNIGQQVNLADFTDEEALPLTEGMGLPRDKAEQVLHWVIKWTQGHPYLTQRLCRTIAERFRNGWTEPEVDHIVATTFFGKMSEEDNNLQFVRDMLIKRAPDKLGVLATYREIRGGGRPVRDEEQSPLKSHLKLSGVVKRENGELVVRNPIYNEVFDRDWIKAHWPLSWWNSIPKYFKIAASLVTILLIASAVSLAMYAKKQRELAKSQIQLADEQKSKTTQAEEFARQQKHLTEAANQARDLAEVRQMESEKAKADAVDAQKKEETERNRAEQQAHRADSLRQKAESAQNEAERNLSEVERARRIDIARALAAQAVRQQQLGQHELGALLARQAFLFNQRNRGPLMNQVYEALLKTLNGAGGPFVLRGHTALARSVAFSSTGETLASSSDDGTVRIWNRQRNFAEPIILSDHKESVRSVAFSPDGYKLASGSDDHSVRVWNLRELKSGSTILNGHKDMVWTVAFSPDGQTLASGGADSAVILWKTNNPNAGSPYKLKHKSRVRTVAFSANGHLLASGGDDGTIQVWELGTKNALCIAELKHESGVKSVAFSPADTLLVSGGADGRIKLWRLSKFGEKLQLLTQVLGHEGPINAVAFSSDGQMLATGSSDKRIKIWDLRQSINEPMLVFVHEDWVWSVAFSPDGNTLVSGSKDKNIRIWMTRPEILAERVCEIVKRNLTLEEWREFVGHDIPYERTCPDLSAREGSKPEESTVSQRQN